MVDTTVPGISGATLSGHRIIVTGGSSGIGAATALKCVSEGARVSIVARSPESLSAVVDQAADFPGDIRPVQVDISGPSGARAAVQEAADNFGGVDAVVHSAGLYLLGNLVDGEYEDWRAMFGLNVLAVLAVSQAAIPHLVDSGSGDIVAIGSIGGKRVARPTSAVYSATKYALSAVVEGLRMEMRPYGVRVSHVLPGVVKTGLGKGTRDPQLVQGVRDKQNEHGIRPGSIADTVAFVLGSPRDVSLNEVVVMPTSQDF